MDEELSQEQIDELHALLVALQAKLKELLQTSSKRSETVDLDAPIGRLTRMDAMQQQSMAQAERRRHELRLLQVNAALQAVDNSAYGDCKRCEEPIAFKRLKARPETPFCLSCTSELERRAR